MAAAFPLAVSAGNGYAVSSPSDVVNVSVASPLDDIQVSGRVIDEAGNPIPGVTVIMQGTTRGTITDTEGSFTLEVEGDSKLLVSMRGYITQEVEVSGRSSLGDITLVKDGSYRGDVAVAYDYVSENDIFGSISNVDIEKLQEIDYTRGAVADLNSLVGGWNGSTIWGMNPSNSSYFVVVDGVPRGLSGYENLIPQEVEQVTFLKGADAVALYGSRGAKGAILITTKRGKVSDGLRIDGRVTTGFNTAISFPEYLSSAEYMKYYNQALKGDGKDPLYSDEDIYNHASGKNPYRYPNIDYYSSDYVKKVYNRTDADIELSGGKGSARYYGNINYWTAGGYLKVGDSKENRTHRYSVRGNVDVKINDFIDAYINSNATFYDVKTAGSGSWWNAAATNRPNRPVNAAPLIPVDKIDPTNQAALDLIGTTKNIFDGQFLAGGQEESDRATIFGDMYAAGSSKYTIRKFQFDAGMKFDLGHLLEGLTFQTILGMDFSTEYTTAFSNNYAVFIPEWADYNGEEYIVGLTKEGNDEKTGNQSISGSVDNRMLNFTGIFGYDRTFGSHKVSAKVLASGSQETKTGTYHSDCSAHLGFSASYNYANRYYVDFNSAVVHSIRLAEGHRNAFSPSLKIGWNLANEDFLKGSFADKLMVWASVSQLHEDYDLVDGDNKYYLYDGLWEKSSWGFTWNDGKNANCIWPNRDANPELEMIKRKEFSFGIRSAFLHKMLELNATYFVNTMDGYLIKSGNDYPSHMTRFVAYKNNNIVKRNGFDFEFAFNKKLGEVDFRFGVVGTYYNTERTKYEQTVKEDYQKAEGRPEDCIWGYKCLGIFQSQEEIDNYVNANGDHVVQNLGSTVQPGDLKYADINNDGKVDEYDRVDLGKYGSYGSPTVLGVNITAKWRNFSLFIAGSGHFGSNWFKNGTYYYFEGPDAKYSAIARDCWSENNKNAKYPRISTENYANNYVTSDFWTYSENAFSLNKVQITYNFPSSMLSALKIVKGLSVYALGENLLLISPNREIMELNVGGAPQSRYYGLGVKATF